jgi:hypothetical protein
MSDQAAVDATISSGAEADGDAQKKLKEQKRLEKLAKFEAKKAKTSQQKEQKESEVEVCYCLKFMYSILPAKSMRSRRIYSWFCDGNLMGLVYCVGLPSYRPESLNFRRRQLSMDI